MKKIIYLILVILWMCFIFINSSYNSDESTYQSRSFAYSIKLVDSDDESILEYVDVIVRKCDHMSEYFILCVLVLLFINSCNIKYNYLISFIICLLYSFSDEAHQLYVPGRSGSFYDVCVDMIGAILSILLFMIIYRKVDFNR